MTIDEQEIAAQSQPAPALPEVGKFVRYNGTYLGLEGWHLAEVVFVGDHDGESCLQLRLGSNDTGEGLRWVRAEDEGYVWRRLQAAETQAEQSVEPLTCSICSGSGHPCHLCKKRLARKAPAQRPEPAGPVLKRGPGPCGPPKAGTPICEPAAEAQGKRCRCRPTQNGGCDSSECNVDHPRATEDKVNYAQRPEPAAEVTTDALDAWVARLRLQLPDGASYEITANAVADIHANLALARAEDQKTIAELREDVDVLTQANGKQCERMVDLRRQLATERAMKEGCQKHLLDIDEALNEVGASIEDDEPTSERAIRHINDLRRKLGEAQEQLETRKRMCREKNESSVADGETIRSLRAERVGALNELATLREDFARVNRELVQAREGMNQPLVWLDVVTRILGAEYSSKPITEHVRELKKESDDLRAKVERRTVLLKEWIISYENLTPTREVASKTRAELTELATDQAPAGEGKV